jgi:hypothetical protein
MYTAEFHTDIGQFSTGGSDASFTGDYDSYTAYINNFLAQNNRDTIAAVYTNDKVYTFNSWSTYLGTNSVRYVAVWNSSPKYYTVTFNSGEGIFSGGGTVINSSWAYNSTGDFTSANSAAKPADVYQTYKLTGWKDQDGRTYSLSDTYTVTGDMSFTAVYEADQKILYTITVSAGGGKFPDGSTQKVFSGYYGDQTNISLDNPSWDSGAADRYYVFSGWSGTIPTAFTENLYITAQYETKFYEFTITFDAGSGTFEGGAKTVTQIYHYGDTINMTQIPVKAEDDYFTYTFNGWNLPLETVSRDMTYTATYLAVSKNTALPAAGIYVSNGENIEDINCNHIPGYTYSMVQTYNQGTYIPVLTITGDNLTFSGSSSSVYVVIEDGVSNVRFDNLVLSGSYQYENGPVNIPYGENGIVPNITISGSCRFENTYDGNGAMRCDRPVVFTGADISASLTAGSVA